PPLLFSPALAPADTYTVSLHDALPISEKAPAPRSKTPPKTAEQAKADATAPAPRAPASAPGAAPAGADARFVLQVGAFANPGSRSEEHTSELQSRENLVCRLLLEKQNI